MLARPGRGRTIEFSGPPAERTPNVITGDSVHRQAAVVAYFCWALLKKGTKDYTAVFPRGRLLKLHAGIRFPSLGWCVGHLPAQGDARLSMPMSLLRLAST